MADNVTIPPTGVGDVQPKVAADEAPYSGDTVKIQVVRLVHVSGVEGSKVVSEIVDANGLDVDVTRVPKSSAASAPAQTPVGTTAGEILAANPARKRLMVQNTGLTVVKLALGAAPTQTLYHVALAPAGAADDGTGAFYVDDMWTGAVQAISSATGGTVVVTELT